MKSSQKIDTNYARVIPRDLFNESKLLKSIGRLCLLIHDNLTPIKMSFDGNGEPFQIGLTMDGYLTIVNLTIYIKEKVFTFKTTYNSKKQYPLFIENIEQNGNCDYLVFDENGNFDEEFIELCKTL